MTKLTILGGKSRVELKVQSLGVVELSSLLVLSSTINPIIEVAIIHPILEDKDTKIHLTNLVRIRKIFIQENLTEGEHTAQIES